MNPSNSNTCLFDGMHVESSRFDAQPPPRAAIRAAKQIMRAEATDPEAPFRLGVTRLRRAAGYFCYLSKSPGRS